MPLHIVKLFIFWYREQEFIVRWGNSLSMTFRCLNGIRQGGQLSPLLYNEYTNDLNHHLEVTGVPIISRHMGQVMVYDKVMVDASEQILKLGNNIT